MKSNLTKHPGSKNFRIVAVLCAAVALSFVMPAQAASTTYYWDTSGTAAGACPSGNTAPGTWNTTTANWSTNSAGTTATTTGAWSTNSTSSNTAIFAAGSDATGSYSVNVVGTVYFLRYVTGLTVQEGNITFNDGGSGVLSGCTAYNSVWWSLQIDPGATATFNVPVRANTTGGYLNKTGGGTVIMNNTLTVTSAININAGTWIASTTAGVSATGTKVVNGGTLGVQVQPDAGGAGWTTAQVNTLWSGATKTSGNWGIDTTNGDVTQWAAFTNTGTSFGTSLGLVKLGSNTLTLNQTNTYAGATTVTGGRLLVNSPGSLAAGNVTVASGATFGGTGTAGGAVTFNSGARASFTVTPSAGVNTTPMTLTGVMTYNSTEVHLNLPTDLPNGAYDLATSGATPVQNGDFPTPVLDSGSYQGGSTGMIALDIGNKKLVLTVSSPGIPPVITSLNPTNGASGVGLAANLVLSFDKSVQKGTGNIVIKDSADNVFESFDVATSGQVTVNGAQVTIDPSSNFAYNTGYYVEIASGAIQDTSSANFAGFSGSSTWNFTTELAPAIATLSPLTGATGVVITGNLVITFNKNVTKGTGNIVIKDSGDNVVETIDVTSGLVTVSGAQVTINPTNNLAYATGYYVLIDNGAFKDSIGGNFAGIADTTTWSLTTETAPVIATGGLSPEDGASGVVITNNLVITFDKVVTKGTGNIVIKKSSDNSDFEVIDVTSTKVTISGAQVTINPANNLGYGTDYYVQIDNGAIVGFAGITDTTTWNFTTELAPAIVGLSPENGATDVVITSNLVIAFDKNVFKGTGNIVIKDSGGTPFETIDVTSGQVTLSGAQVTINPANNLAYGTDYYVQIDSTAIVGFVGIADTTTWNFTTEPAPAIVGLSPEDGATDVPTTANLVIAFDKVVTKGTTGNIVIKDSADNVFETIDVTSTKVTVSGAQVAINPTGVFALSTGYYVQIDDGAIVGFTGIADNTRWNFTTTAEAPVIAAFSPPDDATFVGPDENLVITFDRDVGKGTTGNIVIMKSGDPTPFETIPVTDSKVTVSGVHVTINPTGALDYLTDYYVLIDNGAIAGFAGITDSSRWNFTTSPAGYTRWIGSGNWGTTTNWSPNNVPDATTEVAVFNGTATGSPSIADTGSKNTIVTYTFGQIKVLSPSGNITIGNNADWNTVQTLALSPAGSFGGVGIDMSSATKDLTIAGGGNNDGRRIEVALVESQEWRVTGSGNLTFSSVVTSKPRINLGANTLTVNVGSGRLLDASTGGVFQGTGGSITKTGAGELRFGQANTYDGLTAVQGGTLAYAVSNATATGGVTVNGSSAILDIKTFSDSVGTVTVQGGGQINGTTGVLTSTGTFEMQSGTVSAKLGGSGIPLNKTTAGTVTLTGANTYTGATAVSEGKLLVNSPGSLAATAVTVASGATFGGTGTAAGAVTFDSGAKASFTVTPSAGVNTTPMTLTGVMTYNATAIHLNLPAGLENGSYDLATSSATPVLNGTFPTPVVDSGSYQSGSSGVITLDTENKKLVLTVAEGGGTVTYASWIGGYFGIEETDPAIIGANADPDHDGVANGIEFLTGTIPNNPASHSSPSITRNGSGDLVVTFQRVDDAEAYTVAVEWSPTLEASWTPIVVPNDATTGPPVTVVDNGTAPDDITVIVTGPPEPKMFARVTIALP